MPLLIIGLGLVAVVLIAYVAVARVSVELEGTVSPALLEVADAVDAVSEAVPFEVSATLSHNDVEMIIVWVLEWFDNIGLASDFGEELGGVWVDGEQVVIEEVTAADDAVARAVRESPELSAVHVTVVVDEFMTYLKDIGAVGQQAGSNTLDNG